jgi:hypothetical protein
LEPGVDGPRRRGEGIFHRPRAWYSVANSRYKSARSNASAASESAPHVRTARSSIAAYLAESLGRAVRAAYNSRSSRSTRPVMGSHPLAPLRRAPACGSYTAWWALLAGCGVGTTRRFVWQVGHSRAPMPVHQSRPTLSQRFNTSRKTRAHDWIRTEIMHSRHARSDGAASSPDLAGLHTASATLNQHTQTELSPSPPARYRCPARPTRTRRVAATFQLRSAAGLRYEPGQ